MNDHFGFSENLFDGFYFYQLKSSRIVYMLKGELNFNGPITQIGLPVYKGDFPRGYLTNNFLYRFGQFAKKNTITVSEDSILPLINRDTISYNPDYDVKGHQIIKTQHNILGRGWVRNGMLHLDAPKIWRQNFKAL